MKTIKIDSIEQTKVEFGTKISIISGGSKYSFFNTKKDGSQTKAYEQFKKYGFGIGDTVSAEVKEEERNFTNKEGKNIDYIQRTILYFQEVENTPVVKSEEKRDVWAEIDAIKERLERLDGANELPKVNQDEDGEDEFGAPKEEAVVRAEVDDEGESVFGE